MKKFITNLEDKVSSVLNESLVTDAAELLGIEEQDAEERITGLSFANYIELGNAIDMEDAETVREILGSVAPLEEGLSDEDQRLLRYYSTKHPGPYDDELDIDTSGLEWDDEFGYNLETHPEYDKARLAYFKGRYAAPYADELEEGIFGKKILYPGERVDTPFGNGTLVGWKDSDAGIRYEVKLDDFEDGKVYAEVVPFLKDQVTSIEEGKLAKAAAIGTMALGLGAAAADQGSHTTAADDPSWDGPHDVQMSTQRSVDQDDNLTDRSLSVKGPNANGEYLVTYLDGEEIKRYVTTEPPADRNPKQLESTVDEEKLLDKPTPTLKDLAKKHDVSLADMGIQLAKGIKAEKEHTSDMLVAKEIALDHLNELPDYYDRLEKMEETGSGGGTGAGAVGGGDGGASAGVTAANGYGGIGTWDGKKQKKQKGNTKGTGKGVYESEDGNEWVFFKGAEGQEYAGRIVKESDRFVWVILSGAPMELPKIRVPKSKILDRVSESWQDELRSKLDNMEKPDYSWAKKELYHVTRTEHVPGIQKNGLRPMGAPSNWVQQGSMERYGMGEIYVFTNKEDAKKWAARMDWEFNQTIGSGNISIVTLNRPVDHEFEKDEADPMSQAGAKGDWLKTYEPISPEYITGVQVFKSMNEADNPYASAPSQGSSVDALAQQTKTAQPAKQAGDEEENNLQQRKDVDDLMVGDDIEVIDIDGDPTPVTVKTPRGPGDTVVVQTDKGEEHIVKKQAVSGTPTIQEMYEAALNSSGFSKGDRVFYQPTSGQAMGDRGKGYGTVVDTTTNEYGEENVIVEWDNEEYAAMGRLIHPAHLIKADDNEDEGFWNDMEDNNPFEEIVYESALTEKQKPYVSTDDDGNHVMNSNNEKVKTFKNIDDANDYLSSNFDKLDEAHKTEHSGAKKGKGAYYGRKKDAKSDSNKKRRANDKKALDEVAPPGMEDWIKKRKPEFKKQYGDDWEEVLYATAWKRHNNESIEEDKTDFVNKMTGMPDLSRYWVYINRPDVPYVMYHIPRSQAKGDEPRFLVVDKETGDWQTQYGKRNNEPAVDRGFGAGPHVVEGLDEAFDPATHVNVEHRDPEGRFIIVHAPPAGYWAVGKGSYQHKVDATGFDNFDDALEHAELCLASLDEAADLNKLRRLAGLKETASGGATGAGAIASAPAAMNGGDPVRRSIYDKPTPKKRKKAKESNDGSIGRAKK